MSDHAQTPFINLPIGTTVNGVLLGAFGLRKDTKYPRPESGQPGYDGKCFQLNLEGEWEGSGVGKIGVTANACDFAVKDGILAPPDVGNLGAYRVLIPEVTVEFVETTTKAGKTIKVYNVRARGKPTTPAVVPGAASVGTGGIGPVMDLQAAFQQGVEQARAKMAPGKAAEYAQAWWDRAVARMKYAQVQGGEVEFATARTEKRSPDYEVARRIGNSLFISADKAGIDAPPTPANQQAASFAEPPVTDEDDDGSLPF